jgi:hypothetical protein
VLAHPVHPDRAAERREPFGKRPAEAASGAGDQGNPMLQGTGLVHVVLIKLSHRCGPNQLALARRPRQVGQLASVALPCRVEQPMIAFLAENQRERS